MAICFNLSEDVCKIAKAAKTLKVHGPYMNNEKCCTCKYGYTFLGGKLNVDC